MEGKTYLEILAENDAEARQEFDPNAKDILVDNAHYYEQDVDGVDHHPDELGDQEDFQKEQGSHQASANQEPPKKYDDKTIFSVAYKTRDLVTRVYNVDSRFRDSAWDPLTATNFVYRFLRPIKNVISIRITGIEIPNVMYVFNDVTGNRTFTVQIANGTLQTITLKAGNYEDPYFFIATLQAALDSVFPSTNKFTVDIDPVTAKITISNGVPFTIDFTSTTPELRRFDNGIGYNMGFRSLTYSGQSSYTGEGIVDTIESNYIFLSLGSEYNVIEHKGNNNKFISAFAKILITAPKNGVVFDSGTNVLSKEYHFRQPTDITQFQIVVFDAYNQIINLQGLNFSFTLELDEVLSHSLYQSLTNI